jgi:hypothetical protein
VRRRISLRMHSCHDYVDDRALTHVLAWNWQLGYSNYPCLCV